MKIHGINSIPNESYNITQKMAFHSTSDKEKYMQYMATTTAVNSVNEVDKAFAG